MELSLVDLAPIPEGGTATEAFENTLERAQHAERLGYSRFWVAEHHDFTDRLASTTPEVLIAHLAAQTSDIRVGSGTVLLNHYSPYKVAESFGVLDALAPDRIDLGLGRATGNPVSDYALQNERSQRRNPNNHAEKIDEVTKYFYGGFEDDNPFKQLSITRSRDGIPDIWVLGSSPSSAAVAGELGLRYCFASFIRPKPAVRAFEVYRDNFQPAPNGAGPDEPHGMIAVNVTCADTDEEAARLRAVPEANRQRLRQGRMNEEPIHSVETAIDELGGVPDLSPDTMVPGAWPRQISGSPDTVRDLLEQMTAQTDVKEVIVQNQFADLEDELRSHELLADAVGLTPR